MRLPASTLKVIRFVKPEVGVPISIFGRFTVWTIRENAKKY